jgi:hypothetical protein
MVEQQTLEHKVHQLLWGLGKLALVKLNAVYMYRKVVIGKIYLMCLESGAAFLNLGASEGKHGAENLSSIQGSASPHCPKFQMKVQRVFSRGGRGRQITTKIEHESST